MPKLTKQQREELKAVVIDARIRRLTAKETCALIFDKLGITISIDHIWRLSREIKQSCAHELLLLQKDGEYYLQRMFFDRVAELEHQQRILHEVINNNQHNPDVIVKAVNALHALTVSLSRLFQGLPVATFYIPGTSNYNPIDGNSNITQQQQQSSKPIFGPEDAWTKYNPGSDSNSDPKEPPL